MQSKKNILLLVLLFAQVKKLSVSNMQNCYVSILGLQSFTRNLYSTQIYIPGRCPVVIYNQRELTYCTESGLGPLSVTHGHTENLVSIRGYTFEKIGLPIKQLLLI